MRVIALLLLFTVFCAAAHAQEFATSPSDANPGHKHLWKWSMVALAACTALDAATSMHNSEANPVMRSSNGQFGYRGLLLKSAIASGTIAFEFHFSKKNHMYKPLAIFNFAQASVFAGAAAYNSTFSTR